MIHACTKEYNMLNKILGAIFDRKVQIAFEMDWFKKIRLVSDGIDIINIKFDIDFYMGDHTPRINFMICVINFKLIEMSLYNTYHAEEDGEYESPYKIEPDDE